MPIRITRLHASLAAVALVLSACAPIGPNFVRPNSPVMARWMEANSPSAIAQTGLTARSAPVVKWWETFHDPTLNRLVAEAYAQNLTLQIAGARVLQARAQLGIAYGELFPQSQTVGASTSQREISENIGPIQDFIGEAAERFTRMVGLPRVAFCNTGSEAVSAAVRCARTVTGKDLVASFAGDYHGIHDEVIVRPGPGGRGLPAAGGIPGHHVTNTLILDYGEPKSLEVLRARADELAAIMIEPVQSRRPDLQPRAFMQACREIATQADCALIMDEVITGFRCAPGGAQEYFDVRADLGTYGKVFGGGMPIGAVAGIDRFMDALDGGHWEFGDDSVPEVGVTYFAGTFVRHPINMAAVLATLRHLSANPGLQRELNARVTRFVERIRALIDELRAPMRVAHFSSIYRFEWTQDEPFAVLFHHYLRERGLHSHDGRLAVMTTTHDEAIFERMLAIYRDAISCMQDDQLLGRSGEPVVMGPAVPQSGAIWYQAPQPGARIGRDEAGNPAWYVPDPQRPGTYRQLHQARR